MMNAKKKVEESIEIVRIQKKQTKLHLLGTTPMFMNRLAKKAREQLLLPPRRRNRAALETTQKHNPPDEYRDSVYRTRDPEAPTFVHIPDGALKGALANAALRLPGATKAEIGQLVSVADPTVHLYGIPYLSMMPVRQAGPSRTPDIRTRAVFPQWALEVSLSYISELITSANVMNLASAAGMIVGIGDGRVEKGKFDFGQWEVVLPEDKRWRDIVSKQGRRAQEAALANPVAYDLDTEELLDWYNIEIKRRDQDKPTTSKMPSAAVIAASDAPKRGRGRPRKNGGGKEKQS